MRRLNNGFYVAWRKRFHSTFSLSTTPKRLVGSRLGIEL
jgi:hypothetical protein